MDLQITIRPPKKGSFAGQFLIPIQLPQKGLMPGFFNLLLGYRAMVYAACIFKRTLCLECGCDGRDHHDVVGML
jgi:hypothetical protein